MSDTFTPKCLFCFCLVLLHSLTFFSAKQRTCHLSDYMYDIERVRERKCERT